MIVGRAFGVPFFATFALVSFLCPSAVASTGHDGVHRHRSSPARHDERSPDWSHRGYASVGYFPNWGKCSSVITIVGF
jgi:hypothetical protein